MKATTFILLVLAIAGGVAVVYFWASSRQGAPASDAAAPGRKVLFYQSSMHPWIKADKPGKCTICGMELVPVYEGEKGFESGSGVVSLSSNSIQVLHVQTTPAARRPLTREFRFAGTIDDDDSRHRILSAYVKGRIDELFVNYVGAEVTEGQPLATFYSPALLAAEREYAGLVQRAGNAEDARRLLGIAKSRLVQYGLNEKQIASLATKPPDDLDTEILAPITGTVVARKVYAGQYVNEGDPLFEIADFSRMWLLFDAYEQDLAWLKVGQTVEITTPAVPGKVFTAAISFIDPNLNPMTRSAKVRVEIANPLVEENGVRRRELSHRLYAEAKVSVSSEPTLVVPRSSVLMPESGQAVLYVDRGGGAYEQRTVKLGRASTDAWEVLTGVKEGEPVVTQGNLLIDAQAQLNASANPSAGSHDHGIPAGNEMTSAEPPPSQMPELTAAQSAAVADVLQLADAIAAALAADDLKAFNTRATQTRAATAALTQAFTAENPWRKLVDTVARQAHLAETTDLATARKVFHPFSMAVVELAQMLRRKDTNYAGLKVFRCPMTKDAFEGAPRTADWMQLKAPLQNPYFGAEMLECGVEVKP